MTFFRSTSHHLAGHHLKKQLLLLRFPQVNRPGGKAQEDVWCSSQGLLPLLSLTYYFQSFISIPCSSGTHFLNPQPPGLQHYVQTTSLPILSQTSSSVNLAPTLLGTLEVIQCRYSQNSLLPS